MVKYTHLNRDPGKAMEDLVKKLSASSKGQKTKPTGVKDLGDAGDIVWSRPDAPEFEVSIRDIDGDLQDAQGRIDEAKADSAEALERASGAEATVGAVRDGLDELENVTLPAAVADLEAADAALNANIDSVRTSVDGKNRITQSVDAPPTQYDGAVGDRWERMSSMGSGGQLISNWRWNGTVWVSTVIGDAVLGNVDAAKIGTGFLDAARLRAGSIAASSIAVGDFTNLATIDPVRDINVTRPAVWATKTSGDFITRGDSSQNYLMFKDRTDTVPFTAGDSLLISFSAKASVSMQVQIRLWAYPAAADGNQTGNIGVTGDTVSIGTTEAEYNVTLNIPQSFSGVVLRSWIMGLGPYGGSDLANVGVRNVRVSRMTRTTLLQDGAITTPKLTVTEDMSAAIVDAMSVNAKKLVVTDEAILNHATLIGDTVVDNINVSGKLIGQDGVFTGTVDFENVNVTGLQLVEKLEANSISADKIEGGHFTGETFEGGTFVGGEFRTSDTLPGQVVLADDAYVTHLDGGGTWPGMKVVPIDTTNMDLPAAIGPSANGLTIFGGRNTTGGSSVVQANPTASFMRTYHEGGGIAGTIQTSPTTSQMRTYHKGGGLAGEFQTSTAASFMRTYQADGTTIGGSIQTSANDTFMQTYGEGGRKGNISTDGNSATVRTIGETGLNRARITASDNTVTLFSATNGQRYLELNETGIWIRTGPSSNQKVYNLEETAQDSGWVKVTLDSGYTEVNPVYYRNKGGVIFWRGVITKNSGAWSSWETIFTVPANMRPADEVLRASFSSTIGFSPALRVTTGGSFTVRSKESGQTGQIHLSPMFYAVD